MAEQSQQDSKKLKALELAMTQIERQYGKGSVMRLGERPKTSDVQAIPTGSLALDIALGVGGLPRGRITEIYGQESSGKTTLGLHVLAEAQRMGGVAAMIDAEHALDPDYAARIGLDVDNLLISQPDTGEQALEIAEALIRSGAVDALLVDSVAALVPRAEIEGEMGDSHVGLQARLMSQALRKLASAVAKAGTVVIFLNQIREKVGIMFGNPETTPGGRALKFWSSVRIEMRRREILKKNNEPIGIRAKAKIVKNKVAPPFNVAEFDILFGTGLSKEGDLIDLGTEFGLLDKTGTWFSYGDIRLGQGREKAKDFLRENPELAEELEAKIRAIAEETHLRHLGVQPEAAEAGAEEESPEEPLED